MWLMFFFIGAAQAADFSGTLKLELAPWTAVCEAEHCGIPAPAGPSATLSVKVPDTSGPGSAAIHSTSIEFESTRARIALISIEPHANSPHPPYLQIKMEVTSRDATTVCAQSIRWRLPFEAPPMICGTRLGAQQFGMTATSAWSE